VAELSERRQADRARMADAVARLASAHALSAEIVPGTPGKRCTEVRISGPHTLGLAVKFDGDSPHREPDTHVLSWHMRPWADEGKGWALAPGAFRDVNPHTGTKATDVAHGWPHLLALLTRRFAAIESGAAFVRER